MKTQLNCKLFVLALGTMFFAQACATSQKGSSKFDRDRGQLTVVSTSDKKTAMVDPGTAKPYVRASEKLEQEIKTNPRDVSSTINLAQIRVAQGQLDQAETLAKQALRLDLKNTEAKKILAECAFRKDNTDLAQLILNGLGGSSSKDSQVLNLLALIALKSGKNDESMATFKRALQLNPDDVAVRMNLGVLQLKHRQLNAAAVQFERVLKSMPENRDAMLHLAIIKAFRGQRDEAAAIFKTVLSSKSDNPLALFNLAVVEKQQGELEDALDHVKKYLQTRPTDGNQTTEAFALIDEIQSQRAANGKQVSDEEIQVLAAKMSEQREPTARATKPAVTASRAAPLEQEPQAKAAAPAPAAPATKGKAAPAAGPARKSTDNDSIDDLEKALE